MSVIRSRSASSASSNSAAEWSSASGPRSRATVGNSCSPGFLGAVVQDVERADVRPEAGDLEPVHRLPADLNRPPPTRLPVDDEPKNSRQRRGRLALEAVPRGLAYRTPRGRQETTT